MGYCVNLIHKKVAAPRKSCLWSIAESIMSRKYWKFTRVNLSVITLVFFMTKNVNDIGKWAIVWIRLVEKRQRLGEVIGDRVLKMQHRWCIWPLWTISFIKCLTRKLSGRFFFLLRLLSAKEVSHNSLVLKFKGTEKKLQLQTLTFLWGQGQEWDSPRTTKVTWTPELQEQNRYFSNKYLIM